MLFGNASRKFWPNFPTKRFRILPTIFQFNERFIDNLTFAKDRNKIFSLCTRVNIYYNFLSKLQIANVAFRHRYSIGTLGFIRSTNPEIISLTPLDTDVPPLSLSLIFHSRSRGRVRPFSFASSITRPWATDRGINRAQMKLGGREVNSRTASILLETSASLVFACYTLLPPPFS